MTSGMVAPGALRVTVRRATLAQPLKKSWRLAGTTGPRYRAPVSAGADPRAHRIRGGQGPVPGRLGGRDPGLDGMRQPVVPAIVGNDLGLHLMRFALMESHLPRAAVLAFLADLENALDSFVSAMERYLASGAQSGRPHAELAIEHGIAVHRASLEWTRSALAALSGSPVVG
jgi:hypothetical protein